MNDAGKPVGEGLHADDKGEAAAVSDGAGKAGPQGDEQKKPTEDAGSGASGKTGAEETPGGAQKAQPTTTPPKTQLEAIPLAVDIGWTMAVLFGELQPTLMTRKSAIDDRLPTANELSPQDRMDLEEVRLNALLTRLKTLLKNSSSPDVELPAVHLKEAPVSSDEGKSDEGKQVYLAAKNLDILKSLACAGREYGVAYQLGRSLRDTANPPPRTDAAADLDQPEIAARAAAIKASAQWQADPAKNKLTPEQQDTQAGNQAKAEAAARDALRHQLARSRVSTLQEWLSTLVPYLPANSAAIVSVSIGRWCNLVSTIFDPNTPGDVRRFRAPSKLEIAPDLVKSLLPQGDAWINLLVGTESSQGLLTPEGLVAAGEAALGRTARIVKRIVVHYWFALLILAAALAGALYVSATYLGGAAKVWTQIAAVAGALGVTAKGIGSTMARLYADAEKPIFSLEETDAMAWAVTTIPANLKVSIQGVHALRRNGIPPSGPMGRS